MPRTHPRRPRRLPPWLPPAVRVAVGVLALTLGGYASADTAVRAGNWRLADACLKAATVAAATVAIAAPSPLGNTVTVVSQRLIGGIVGGGVAAALSFLPPGALAGSLQGVVGVALAAGLTYIGQDSALQYMATFRLACYLVVTATAGGGGGRAATTLAIARGVGALIGAAASGVLAATVLPQTASTAALDAVQAALDGVAALGGEQAAAADGALVTTTTVTPPPPTLLAPATAEGVRRVLAALENVDRAMEWAPTETPALRARGRTLFYLPSLPSCLSSSADLRAAKLDAALGPVAASLRAAAHTWWLVAAARVRPRSPAVEAALADFTGGGRLGDAVAPAAAALTVLADAWAARRAPPDSVAAATQAAAASVAARAAAAMTARRGHFAATGQWGWADGLSKGDAESARVHGAAEVTLAARVASDVAAVATAVAGAVEVARRIG